MNLLILLAGPSIAFTDAGYTFPKPLIEINGKPLIQLVIEHLEPLVKNGARLIFLIRYEDNFRYHISSVIKLLSPAAKIVEVRGETSGAACTALLAVDWIANPEQLIILNGDQIIEEDLFGVVCTFQKRQLDGGIIVFKDVHPRWSFVKCNVEGMLVEAAEKRPISNLATAGFYYFASGAKFVEAAQSMILKDASVNGLFYVCPTYNELVLRNCQIGIHEIHKTNYISLSTPQGVQSYECMISEFGLKQ